MIQKNTNGRANGVRIRPLTLSDAQDLQRHCFPGESLESVADYVQRALGYVERGRSTHLVAETGGRAVANAQLLCWRKRAEIGSLVVAEPLRGQGVGSALIEALSHAAAHMGVEQIEIGADEDNKSALDLSRHLGFTPYKKVRVPGNGSAYDRIVYLIKHVPLGDN